VLRLERPAASDRKEPRQLELPLSFEAQFGKSPAQFLAGIAVIGKDVP